MRTNTEKRLRTALLAYFSIPEEINERVNQATFDLYFGPHQADSDYPGFTSALDQLKTWTDTNIPSELWIDLDCDHVSDTEPQGYTDDETGEYIEPYLDNTWHIESTKEILRLIWDKELVACL